MNRSILVCTVVLAISVPPALAQPPDPSRRGASPQPTQPPQGTPARTESKPGGDQQFVMNVAKDGMAEVELGKLASQKATNDQVKQFGQRMADDHGKANDELKKLASDKNITIPTETDVKHKATIDKLSKMTGDAFDRAFTQEMVNGHKKAVSAFKTESKNGKDAEVKAWAAKTLPTLEEHLKQVQELSRSVVGTSGVKQTDKPKAKN
jgi:putative membrane protein